MRMFREPWSLAGGATAIPNRPCFLPSFAQFSPEMYGTYRIPALSTSRHHDHVENH